jgi:hypothetical protein
MIRLQVGGAAETVVVLAGGRHRAHREGSPTDAPDFSLSDKLLEENDG